MINNYYYHRYHLERFEKRNNNYYGIYDWWSVNISKIIVIAFNVFVVEIIVELIYAITIIRIMVGSWRWWKIRRWFGRSFFHFTITIISNTSNSITTSISNTIIKMMMMIDSFLKGWVIIGPLVSSLFSLFGMLSFNSSLNNAFYFFLHVTSSNLFILSSLLPSEIEIITIILAITPTTKITTRISWWWRVRRSKEGKEDR